MGNFHSIFYMEKIQAAILLLPVGAVRKEIGMAERKEKRKIERVEYSTRGVIVICDTQEKVDVEVENVSPLGIGVVMEPDGPDLLEKDIIIVTETLIMYAEVIWQEKREDGRSSAGIAAKKFTEDVLQYLFDNIAMRDNEKGEKESV